MRRKAAAVTKATAADDKRLGAVLKRLQCNVRAAAAAHTPRGRGQLLAAAAAPRPALLTLTPPLPRALQVIPGIEEVSIVKDDGSAVVFANPKVQAAIGSNTYVVSGTAENKSADEMLSGAAGAASINPAQLKALQEALKAVRALPAPRRGERRQALAPLPPPYPLPLAPHSPFLAGRGQRRRRRRGRRCARAGRRVWRERGVTAPRSAARAFIGGGVGDAHFKKNTYGR